jgi:hypothetical protein
MDQGMLMALTVVRLRGVAVLDSLMALMAVRQSGVTLLALAMVIVRQFIMAAAVTAAARSRRLELLAWR